MAVVFTALFAVVASSGVALVVLGSVLSGRSDAPGAKLLATFAVVLGLGAVCSAVVGVWESSSNPTVTPLWTQLGLTGWALSTVPWFLFALVYTGRSDRIGRRTVAALYLPFAGLVMNFVWGFVGSGISGVANAIGSLVLLYTLALAAFGAVLVVQAARSYVHLSLREGVGLAAAPVLVVLALNSVTNLQQSATVLGPAVYAASLSVSTAALWAVLARDSVLDRVPAVETVGTREIIQETDDLVFVVDDRGTVVECNPRVVEILGVNRPEILGEPVTEGLGEGPGDLRTRETISLETTAGRRQYDPQVSELTHGDTELGAVLSLRDVTDRQLREQRLAVLNRVLRHNLRNKIDVIKSHAEVLRDDRPNQHVHTITETADEIRDLGYEARTIDRFLSESTVQEVDLVEVFETQYETVEPETDGLSVWVDHPETAVVTTDRAAVEAALKSALENAVSYASSTVEVVIEADGDGYAVLVSDDGSGIPEQELDSIDAGTETPLQHGTGLGLWQLKWAVTTVGGELSFETADGTTVRFTVPDVS
ncbi:PAS domain S-box protein [Halovenus sp. WSH3]|uniref:histidine kinase n=1 Tax=Halovenus carboxidivorans TaxID=2692199 RepID=A0A6B0T597_9EURY|nr:ATP-binding protein [Halovenus carboxidivorans]MXR50070.1 PAS domain S-box protein [Halovenus carboxidivorans]